MGRRTTAVILAASVLAGCYAYVPADPGGIAPEQRVRVRLSPQEAQRLGGFLAGESRDLDGRVVTAQADSLLLLVPTHSELRGARVETLHQRVNVARAGILDVEERRLDRPRTYLVAGAAAGGLAVLVAKTIFGEGGPDRVGTDPVPNDARIPMAVRIPFSLLRLLGR